MWLRNVAIGLLALVAVAAFAVAFTTPGWDNARLVGLVAFALITMDLLARGGPPTKK